MKRTFTALLLVLLVGSVAATPASALPVLEEADAAELAQALADATEAQGVCYGWAVSVQDQSGGESGEDAGSNAGPGTRVDQSCPKWVELLGSIQYTCETCEAEDGSRIAVRSNFEGAPTEDDLQELGFSGGQLVKETNDVVLTNMVGALPLITASNGAAEPVPLDDQAQAEQPAKGDVPTGTPSTPDWLRESWLSLVFFIVLAIGGLIWLVRLAQDGRQTRRAVTPDITPEQ